MVKDTCLGTGFGLESQTPDRGGSRNQHRLYSIHQTWPKQKHNKNNTPDSRKAQNKAY
jgi:hypothetical protein